MKTTKTLGLFAAAATLGLLSSMCGSEAPAPTPSTGGAAPATGGAAPTTGGAAPATGGAAPATGGAAPATGGAATGGAATGGAPGGGAPAGGTAGSSVGGGGGAGGAAGAAAGGGAGGKAGGGAGGAAGSAGMGGSGGAAGGGGKAGGGGGSGGGATGTFKQVADLLASKCAGCHKSDQSALVNLTNGDNMLYTRLTTPIGSGVAKCNDQVLADKSTPANSLLPKVLQGPVNIAGSDAAHTCDVPRMPKGGMMMSAANIATITSWINAGAPQN